MITEETIKRALHAVKYPGFSRDIISFGLVKQIAVNGDAVSVHMDLNSPNREAAQQIKTEAERAIRSLPGITHVFVEVKTTAASATQPAQPQWAGQARMPGVRRVVAVASGKGGVGKSTVSANLACSLKHLGARVGLLDCD